MLSKRGERNLEKLLSCMRHVGVKVPLEGEIERSQLLLGDPKALTFVLRLIICGVSPKVLERYYVHNDWFFVSLDDDIFVHMIWTLLGHEYRYSPSLSCDQFLQSGNADSKVGTLIDILRFVGQHHSQLSKEECQVKELSKRRKLWLKQNKAEHSSDATLCGRQQTSSTVQWNMLPSSRSRSVIDGRGIYKAPKEPLPDPISRSNEMATMTQFKLLGGCYISTRELDERDICNKVLETCREDHPDYRDLLVAGSCMFRRGRMLPDTSITRVPAHDGYTLQVIGNCNIPRDCEQCFIDNCLFSFSDMSADSGDLSSASLLSTASIELSFTDEGTPRGNISSKVSDPLSKTTIITPLPTDEMSCPNGGHDEPDPEAGSGVHSSSSNTPECVLPESESPRSMLDTIRLLDTEEFNSGTLSRTDKLSQTVNLLRKNAWDQPELKSHSSTQEVKKSLPLGMGLRESLIKKQPPTTTSSSICKMAFTRPGRCRTAPLKKTPNEFRSTDVSTRSKSVGGSTVFDTSELPPSPPGSLYESQPKTDDIVHIEHFTELVEKNIIKSITQVAISTCDKERSEMTELFKKYNKPIPAEVVNARSSYWVQRRMIIDAVKRKLAHRHPDSRLVLFKKGASSSPDTASRDTACNIDFGKSIKLADLAKVETAELRRNSLLGFEWGTAHQSKKSSPSPQTPTSVLTTDFSPPFSVDFSNSLQDNEVDQRDVISDMPEMTFLKSAPSAPPPGLTNSVEDVTNTKKPIDAGCQNERSDGDGDGDDVPLNESVPLSLKMLRNDGLRSLSSSSILAHKIPVALATAVDTQPPSLYTPLSLHTSTRRRNPLRSKHRRTDTLRNIQSFMRSDEFNLSKTIQAKDVSSTQSLPRQRAKSQPREVMGTSVKPTRTRSCEAPQTSINMTAVAGKAIGGDDDGLRTRLRHQNQRKHKHSDTQPTPMETGSGRMKSKAIRSMSCDTHPSRTRDGSSSDSIKVLASPRVKTRSEITIKTTRARSHDLQLNRTRNGSSTESVRTIKSKKRSENEQTIHNTRIAKTNNRTKTTVEVEQTRTRDGSSTESVKTLFRDKPTRISNRNAYSRDSSSTESVKILNSQMGRLVHSPREGDRHKHKQTKRAKSLENKRAGHYQGPNADVEATNDSGLVKHLTERVCALEQVISAIREESRQQQQTFGLQFQALADLIKDVHRK